MKALSAPLLTALQAQYGAVVAMTATVAWATGTKVYGTCTGYDGLITEVGDLSLAKKGEAQGSLGAVTITVEDSSDFLHNEIKTQVTEGVSVTLKVVTGALSDVIFEGALIGGLKWTEGSRTCTLEIESRIEVRDFGYTLKENDFAYITKDAEGQALPLAFGNVLKVPALQIKGSLTGILYEKATADSTSFVVEGGERFPQGATVTISIDGVHFTGTFAGKVFTVTSANTAIYTNIAFTNGTSRRLTLTNDQQLYGQFIYYNNMINFVMQQNGKVCYLAQPWHLPYSSSNVSVVSGSLAQSAKYPRASWGNYTIGATAWEQLSTDDSGDFTGEVIEADVWEIMAGSQVTLIQGTSDVYVCNMIPSSAILEVWGHRTASSDADFFRRAIPKGRRSQADTNENSASRFVPIPSSYYTVNLSESITMADATAIQATTLTFAVPLVERENEGWDGSVFVSYRSSVGTNVADVLKYILEAYTDYTVDATSYNAVKADVADYPVSFCLSENRNAMAICEEIAWQARCALIVYNGTVFMKYLSQAPGSGSTILDESDIELKTLVLSTTGINDIYTQLTAKWSSDYSGRAYAERQMEYSNNVDIYGARKKDVDFYIYNIEECVRLSLNFWGYRYSKSWRKAQCNLFPEQLGLDPFDAVEFDLTLLGSLAEVDEAAYNPGTLELHLAATLTMGDDAFWCGDPDYSVCDSWDAPGDVGAGLAQVDYTVPKPDVDDVDGRGGFKTSKKQYHFAYYLLPLNTWRGVFFNYQIDLRDENENIVHRNVNCKLTVNRYEDAATIFYNYEYQDELDEINIVRGIWDPGIDAHLFTDLAGSDCAHVSFTCERVIPNKRFPPGTSDRVQIDCAEFGDSSGASEVMCPDCPAPVPRFKIELSELKDKFSVTAGYVDSMRSGRLTVSALTDYTPSASGYIYVPVTAPETGAVTVSSISFSTEAPAYRVEITDGVTYNLLIGHVTVTDDCICLDWNKTGGQHVNDIRVQKSIVRVLDNLQLDGDDAAPLSRRYYGTDDSAVKGFHSLVGIISTFGDLTNPPVKILAKDASGNVGWVAIEEFACPE